MKRKTLIALAMVGASTFVGQAVAHNHDFSATQTDMLKGFDSVTVSYSVADIDKVTNDEISGDSLALEYSKRLGNSTFVQLGYERGELSGSMLAQDLDLTTLYAGVGAAFAMGEKSLVDLTMGLQHMEAKTDATAFMPSTDVDDTAFVVGLGAERQINRYLSVRGGVAYGSVGDGGEMEYSLSGRIAASDKIEFGLEVIKHDDAKEFGASVSYLF
jgi:hypothetical protein